MSAYPTVYNKTSMDDDQDLGLDLENMDLDDDAKTEQELGSDGNVYADGDDKEEIQQELEVKN